MGKFGDFVLEHADDECSKLLLSKHKWPDIDMDLAVNAIEVRRKIRHKLPSLYATPDIIYPTTLCTEQCSGENAASYNCSVALDAIVSYTGKNSGGFRIADLTGGLGVDSMTFALDRDVSQVLYNEANPLLAAHAPANFALMDAKNITVRNMVVEPGRIGDILGGFKADIIYMDPARRDEGGRKLFLLEDCRPDVLTVKDELLAACPLLLLKLSPMADIDMMVSRLGNVREVHCVGVDGECKELLVLMEQGWEGDYMIKVADVDDRDMFTVIYSSDSEEKAVPIYLQNQKELLSYKGMFLYEPGKALSKAGVFKSISQREGMPKIAPSTHLYLCKEPSYGLDLHGKLWRILEILPFGKSSMRHIATRYRITGVTSRNLPVSSDALAHQLLPSNPFAPLSVHVFAFRADFSDHSSGKFLLVAHRSK